MNVKSCYDGLTGYYGLPCLGGSDATSRTPGTLIVDVVAGELREPNYGQPLVLGDIVTLRGWGELDGPNYTISTESGAWRVNVPVDLIDQLSR